MWIDLTSRLGRRIMFLSKPVVPGVKNLELYHTKPYTFPLQLAKRVPGLDTGTHVEAGCRHLRGLLWL